MWAILEPLALILVLSFVRMMFGRSNIAGLSFPVFFASGILGYLLFQHILMVSLSAVESNLGLFNYQRVKPVDPVVSRSLVELLITLGTAIFIFPGLYLIGFTFVWNDTLLVLATLVLLYVLALGVGLALSILGPLWQESKKIVPVVIRPLFFISGIFFPANSLPDGVRELALINPLLHVSELLRSSMFKGSESAEGSLAYLTAWALGCLFLGLCIYRVFRVRVVTSGNIR